MRITRLTDASGSLTAASRRRDDAFVDAILRRELTAAVGAERLLNMASRRYELP